MGFLDFLKGGKKAETQKEEVSKHFQTFLEQGRIELESKSFEKAVEYFEKAIAESEKIKSNPAEKALVYKARALDGLGRFNESEAIYDKAFELKPEEPWIWHMRGLSYMDQGLNEKAMKYFDKAFELNPMFEEPMMVKASLCGKNGREDVQIECYQRILQANPSNESAKQKIQKMLEDNKMHKNRQWLGGITKGMKLREGLSEEAEK
ncbi:MAG: tetratricopeptide repeat protein [Candidatus Altiarchaeales archaeon]|nr:tetratricopeptide repeat protein [Candidatus Altiarchaeales archaeon]